MSVFTEVHSLPPSTEQSTDPVSKRLLITLVCGLFWDIGSSLARIAFLSWALGGLATFSDSELINIPQAIGIGLGLVIGALGPVLLSYFLSSNWKLAFRNGLFAALSGWAGALAGWMAGGIFTSWLGSINLPAHQRLVFQLIDNELNLVLPSVLSTLAAIAVVALTSMQPFSRRSLGLGAGLVVGLVLSMLGWLIIPGSLIVPSPFIWVSVIFCIESIAGRIWRKDLMACILLLIVAYSLPFVLAFLIAP